MNARSTRSSLLGFTAAAALLAMGAAAQAQAPRDGTPGNPPSTATQRAADAATGNPTRADGTPGNPPGTAAGRAADRAGDAASNANQRAGDPLNTQNRADGTPGNPPGTALGRATDRALGNAGDANQRAGDPANTQNRADGAPGNPPGTVVTRGVDRALGTNMSGAFPQNEQGGTSPAATDGNRATVTGRGEAAQGGRRDNEPPAASANPGAMGSSQSQSGAQGSGMPGPVNATPEGGQARAGTMSVPLQNQAAGNAPANPAGPNGGSRPMGTAATAGAATGAASGATAPSAQTERASRIIGSSVFNERNESIGSVDDLILAQGNASPMAVVSVGGFLGIGAKLVAVPMSELRWSAADNRWTITGATRESLTSLPAYSYDAARRG
ncbi:PRC-barrel domain-containing protein [Muricoccus vinaceus]|uniref:PRC-barrel domain-containing protein n=1 Tax=Muricoccus vinaceus TaxID=424704 RepID=A0ABV6J121_9PROT